MRNQYFVPAASPVLVYVVTLALTVAIWKNPVVPDTFDRSILNPVSVLSLSFHVNLIADVDVPCPAKFDGATGGYVVSSDRVLLLALSVTALYARTVKLYQVPCDRPLPLYVVTFAPTVAQ